MQYSMVDEIVQVWEARPETKTGCYDVESLNMWELGN